MLSAALRSAAPSVAGPGQPSSVQPRLPPSILQQHPASKILGTSCSSLTDEPLFSDSPRGPSVGMPLSLRSDVRMQVEQDSLSSSGDEQGEQEGLFEADLEPDNVDNSASSSHTAHPRSSFMLTPSIRGPLGASMSRTSATLQSAGPSGEFTIGRAAMSIRGDVSELHAELEQMSYGGARGSRPIGIPRGAMASTYHPAAGAYMQGFVPPHELAAQSVQATGSLAVHSHRHKSTAERLRSAVFEQTGVLSVTTAAAFLHTQPVHVMRQDM